MKFFTKISKSKKALIIGFLSLVVVFIVVVFSIKFNFLPALTTNKEDTIDRAAMEKELEQATHEFQERYKELEKQKNKPEYLIEPKLSEGDSVKAMPFIEKPRTPRLAYDDSDDSDDSFVFRDLLYRFEPYHILQGWNYDELYKPPFFSEVGQNNFQKKIENEYKERIMTALSGVFCSDRSHVIFINCAIDFAILRIDRITVSVNIDGNWIIKYNEKGKPVLLADGSIEREYIPIPPQVLRVIKLLIQDSIGYNVIRGDSVTVSNIAFDRVNEFIIEDSKYFRQEKIKYIFLLIIPLMIIISVVIIIKKKIIVRHTL
jgi:flagellar biosynthesis/type III secretory pathway M-ring protein FliF/YscJ